MHVTLRQVDQELPRAPGCYPDFDGVRPGAKVSREANALLKERFADTVDRDFAEQPRTGRQP